MARRILWILCVCAGLLTGGRVLAAFSGLPESISAGTSPRGLCVGDLSGSGKAWLVVANFGAPTFIGQTTDSSLFPSANSNLQVFSPSSLGLQLEATLPTALSPRGVVFADIDEDGLQEILVTAYEGALLQVFAWQAGTFVKTDEEDGLKMPVGLAAGRATVGGPRFVAVADHGSNQLVLFQVEQGRLGKRQGVPVGQGPVQAAWGDLDGDGKREVAVVCLGGGRVDIVQAGEGASVLRSLSLPQGSSPSDLRIVDLDGDGREDLALSDFSRNGIQVFLQREGSLVEQPFLQASGQHPNGLEVADLDGDGIREILVPNRDSDSIDLFRKEGGTYRLVDTLRTSTETDASFGPVELGVLDSDGDGRLDIVATHMRSGSLKIFRGLGTGVSAKNLSQAGGKPTPLSPETTFAQPNPSRTGDVSFVFSLEAATEVLIRVFDITGTPVWGRSLGAGETHAGENQVPWKGVNQGGDRVSSGLYLYQITAGGRTVTKKVSIIR